MGQQDWLANHVYAVGAVVSPTTFTGYLWHCTTAGTSAGTEPAWPANPSVSPTISDGATLVWTVGTGFRQAIHAGILSTLQAFQSANPTILRKVWHARPGSFNLGELPCAVLGDFTETITTMNGVRQRIFNGFTVQIVDRAPDAQEADDRMNFLVDAILDPLTAAFHMASGRSIVEPIGVGDGDSGLIAEGTNVYWYSNVITFRAYVQEGRD